MHRFNLRLGFNDVDSFNVLFRVRVRELSDICSPSCLIFDKEGCNQKEESTSSPDSSSDEWKIRFFAFQSGFNLGLILLYL